jgi:hypothetical protein
MADKGMTRAEALEFAIEHIDNAEVAEVLGKMLASITKPRKKSEAPSKARLENERLLAALVEAIKAHGEPVNAKWVTEHVNGIMTTQKAAAVARLGIELGAIAKVVDGRKVTYTLA